uniref:Uncharacterized protein n=1 Tax=Avena sativa TaxID=4498 RepID=A0ACD5YTU8_AVESA
MAATTCAYGYGSSSCPTTAPAPAAMVGSPTAARSLQAIDPFGHQRYGHAMLGPIIHGVLMPPPPAPPPPPLPPPPPPLDLHSGARSGHPGSNKATSRDPGLCTEGLGSESSESSGGVDLGDAIEDMEAEQYKGVQHFHDHEETTVPARASGGRRVFPPPISVIGAAGKPWQYLRAHRGDGRLVLREVRIPSRELLQACREDGRLKLHFARQDQQLVDDDQCHGQEVEN